VVASLLSKPRPDGDAQRPLEDAGAATAVEVLALPAPGGFPSAMTAAAETGDTQPSGAEPAADGDLRTDLPLVAAAAPSGDQPASAVTGGPLTDVMPGGQSDATKAEALQPADALAPAVSTDGPAPPAAGLPAAHAQSADLAASSGRHPDDAAVSIASAAPRMQASPAAPDADLDMQPGGRDHEPSDALLAQHPVGPQPPPAPDTAVVAPADAMTDAAAQPQPAVAAVAGEQRSQRVTAVSAEPPPRPQPPPPPQLLLLPDDASAEELQAEALVIFRELYPIFEPFQARGAEL